MLHTKEKMIEYEDYALKVRTSSRIKALVFFGFDSEADLWRVRVADEYEADIHGNRVYEIYTRDKTDKTG